MAGQVIPIGFRAFDATGAAYSGAKLYTYVPGTTTPKTTYTTDALSVAHANPIVADSSGVFPQAWADDNATFDLVLDTSADVQVDAWEDVTALAVDTDGAISRDFGTGGRLLISGVGGEVSIEGGPPVGDNTGGTVRIGGWEGTQADVIELDADSVRMTGDYTDNNDRIIPARKVSEDDASGATFISAALPAGFTAWRVLVRGLTPSANAAVSVQFSFDNGSSWKTGASDYKWAQVAQVTGSSLGGTGDNADTGIVITGTLATTANLGTTVDLEVYAPLTDGETTVFGQSNYTNTSNNYATLLCSGSIVAGYGTPTNIRLLASTGNLAGTITVYGLI